MKCRFEHDGDCCNSGATQYMCKCKQPCDAIISITNADRIRAMSDEELAEWLTLFVLATLDASGVSHDDFVDRERERMLAYLKQPAEEE